MRKPSFPRVRTGTSTLVVIIILLFWVYRIESGFDVPLFYDAVIALYAIAAGYVVFGKLAINAAKDVIDERKNGD